MCNGFGLIVDKNLDAYFIEPDDEGDVSHSDIIYRLGWSDSQDTYIRSFVRIEFPDWTPESFQFDEEDTLPGWAEEHRVEIKDKCVGILEICAPIHKQRQQAIEVATQEFDKVNEPAWAERVAKMDAAYEKNPFMKSDFWDEWSKIRDDSMVEYRKATDSARDTYNNAYKAIRAETLAKFSAIKGYAPPRPEEPRDEIPL